MILCAELLVVFLDISSSTSYRASRCGGFRNPDCARHLPQPSSCRLGKNATPAAESTASSRGPTLEEADPAILDEFNRNLAQHGEEIAVQQQELFTSALETARVDAEAVEEANPQLAEQQLLQQRQAQEDFIKRNAKHISPTLHAQMQRSAPLAQADNFSRTRDSGN